MEKKICLKCGFTWIPRKDNPVSCPQCKSRIWNKKREITPEGDIDGNRDSVKE